MGRDMKPIQLLPSLVASTTQDLVVVALAASDQQVVEKKIADPDGQAEFAIASDALNLHRIIWRCAEEWGISSIGPGFIRQLKNELCRRRGYDPDEFESALLATRGRARLPFGWTALALAVFRANKKPIRLLPPDLADSRLATQIANVARQLQLIQDADAILLPIEQLRELFGQRKIVISGTVMRLVEGGVLTYVDKNYHTGKAREYRFSGREHEHYEEIEEVARIEA